jgi:hypothetical protein
MLDDFKQFWAKPFSVDMSVPGWIAFLALVLVINIWWQFVLRHITRA